MSDFKLPDSLKQEKRAMFAERFLEKYLDPALGTMTKAEIDLLVFCLLHEIGVISKAESQYEVARKLRITTARVRILTMQMQLRDAAETDGALRDRLVEGLGKCRFSKEGTVIQFGIEDPLLREFAVVQLKKIGATADSSFNREIVRIQLDAFSDLVQELLPADRREMVRKALIKAGVEDASLKAVLLGALGKLGEKVAGKAGEIATKELADSTGPIIKELFSSASGVITTKWKKLLGDTEGSTSSAEI